MRLNRKLGGVLQVCIQYHWNGVGCQRQVRGERSQMGKHIVPLNLLTYCTVTVMVKTQNISCI